MKTSVKKVRTRPETSEQQRQAPGSRTNGPAVLVLALVLASTAAHAFRVQDSEPEPLRPPQAVLDAVPPLGLAVSMGQPFEIPPSAEDDGGWFVPVECGPADGERVRLDEPTPGEQWLFGVLWSDGSPGPVEPRSYVQAAPILTLLLSSNPQGDIHEAAWGIFMKCPSSTERMLFELSPADVLRVIGASSAWMRADAVGLARDNALALFRAVQQSDSVDEAAEALIPLAGEISTGDAWLPVDGLMNGGPVFEVREFTIDPELPRIPSALQGFRQTESLVRPS